MPTKYTALVLDLGGVCFSTPKLDVGLPPRKIANALDSPPWHEYERGKLSQLACYKQVASMFGLEVDTWANAIFHLTKGQQVNNDFVSTIRQLKAMYPDLKVYCLSNIPGPAFIQLKDIISHWNIFDAVYTSAQSGYRKPDVAAFQNFLTVTREEPESCIFVDDRLENVVVAQSLGFHSLCFHDTATAVSTLHNLLGDPIERGMEFLKRNAKNLYCVTNDGEIHKDNFSQLLIFQNTGDRSLVHLEEGGCTWNYFIGDPVMVDTWYPNDSDTTSLAMVLLEGNSTETKEEAMTTILSHMSPDGLPYTWLQENRPRFCHCICANVYRFFYLSGCADKLPMVYPYLCNLLRTGAFSFGSRYYKNPDWFLYILSDLCVRRPTDHALGDLRELVIARLQERAGCDKDILGAALRLVSTQSLGLDNEIDLSTLLNSQQADGGWETVWLWRSGKEAIEMGGRGVVTAMAVRGLRNALKP